MEARVWGTVLTGAGAGAGASSGLGTNTSAPNDTSAAPPAAATTATVFVGVVNASPPTPLLSDAFESSTPANRPLLAVPGLLLLENREPEVAVDGRLCTHAQGHTNARGGWGGGYGQGSEGTHANESPRDFGAENCGTAGV